MHNVFPFDTTIWYDMTLISCKYNNILVLFYIISYLELISPACILEMVRRTYN